MIEACSGPCPPPASAPDLGQAWGFRSPVVAVDFPAAWPFGRWPAPPGWLHVGPDLVASAAYIAIPLVLACYLARRRAVPFPRLTGLLAAFLLACGLGHAVEALISWHPAYRLAGAWKAIMAALSWAAAGAIIRGAPAALRLSELARSARALRQSEERLALAARGTEHGIWDWDTSTGEVYYSDRYRELLGYSGPHAGEMAGPWEDRLHPEDRGPTLAALAGHFERHAPFDVEQRLRTRTGEYRWFEARGQAVWGGDGRPSRMVGSIGDITARKQQEAVISEQVRLAEFGRDIALALSQDAPLAEMLDRCARVTVDRLDGAFSRIWTADEAGQVLELRASAGMYTHLDGPHARIPVGGYKIGRIALEQRPHLTNSVVGDPAVPDQEWAAREGMVAFAGYPLVVGERLIGVWALFARRPLSATTLTAMESVAWGIALGIERQRSASALLRSEAEARKLALIAARTDNAVILTDPRGRIEWVNAGFTRITGFAPAEAIGRTPGSLLQGPGTDPAAVEYMRERRRLGEAFRTEMLNYGKDGREYWVSVEVQPIYDDAGLLIHFMAIESDVTERRRAEEALRRSEERFALAVRGTDEGLWDWDVVTGVVYYSPRFAGFLGREAVGFEGTLEDWRSRLHPEDSARVLAAIAAHLEGRTPFDAEYRLLAEGGEYRWFRGRGQAVRDEAGQAVRMAGAVGDITERKRLDQQLRLLQAAVEHANDVILITEAEPVEQPGPRVVYVNQAFTRNTGYAASEIIGKTPRMLQGPGTDRAALAGLRKDLKNWKPVRVELLNYAKDGREFWVELNIRPVADASGWYTHWVSIQRDITERKRVERALEAAHRERRDIMEAVPDLLYVISTEGRLVRWNRRVEALTGLSPAEIAGRPAADFFPEAQRALVVETVRRTFEAGYSEFEADILRADGSTVPHHFVSASLKDGEGKLIGMAGLGRDITERKRAEGQVRNLTSQLEQRILRLDALRQIDLAISGSLDLRLTLGIVLDQVLAQLKVDAAAILLVAPDGRELTCAADKGFRTDAMAATSLRPGEGPAGRAVLEQRLVAIPDLAIAGEGAFAGGEPGRDGPPAAEGFVAYHAMPLVAKGQALGVLEVYHRSAMQPDREWVAFFEVLARQAAIAIDNAALLRDLQRSHANMVAAYDATIEGWAKALDLRDKETEGHTRRVTEVTVRLARFMGVDESEILAIRRGSLLHDIGKLGIPDSILLKPGKLTEDEWRIMRRHPEYAFEWLAPIATLRPALDIPHCHHEKWDGTGYPRGLRAEQIPLAARIFAVVDIWDALSSDRPYREGWAKPRVLEHIRSLSGNHLDPAVAEAFLRLMGQEPGPARPEPGRPPESHATAIAPPYGCRFGPSAERRQSASGKLFIPPAAGSN